MSNEKDRHGMHVVNAGGYQQVLQSLSDALEPHHHEDRELHQLYLETQWLLANQQSGGLILPTSWDLIVFKMIRGDKLDKLPEALLAARQLVHIIKKIAHCHGSDEAITS